MRPALNAFFGPPPVVDSGAAEPPSALGDALLMGLQRQFRPLIRPRNGNCF